MYTSLLGGCVIAWGLSIHYFRLTMRCSLTRSREGGFFFLENHYSNGVWRIQVEAPTIKEPLRCGHKAKMTSPL